MDAMPTPDPNDDRAERDAIPRHEHPERELEEALEEKRATNDRVTAREAFEVEVQEEDLSEEAGAVGDEID